MSNKMNLSFSATDPYVEINKVLPTEKIFRGQSYVSWGEDNKYPDYLYSLYSNVSTLKTIINACREYISGEEILSNNNVIISNEELDELIDDIALSYLIYGGFALNVLRNKRGDVCKIVCLDFRKVRSDEKGDVFYYSKDFNKKYVRKIETIVLPKFVKEQTNVNSSIFYYKNDKYSVYPTPIYGAAITACELEKSIDDFHLNSINNCFMGSVMVNLNNGVPTDEIKSEIERNFNEKFSGKDNAGRVVISYNNDKDHGAEIVKIDTEDFSERYKALAERSRQQIFMSFRVTPNILGLPTETTGFSLQEFKEAYALFYTTVIRPIQKLIVDKVNYLFGNELVNIVPFKVEFEDTEDNEKNITD